MAKSLD